MYFFERKTGVVMSEDEHFRASTGLQIGQTRKTPDQKNIYFIIKQPPRQNPGEKLRDTWPHHMLPNGLNR